MSIHALIFMSVLLSAKQVDCLELSLFKQIKRAIWNYLIGHVLLGDSNEQASKEPEPMVLH
ncbi:hypothetical protein AU489_17160 [Lonsdalea populi]|uniref:Uncharacterized protein n=1 Tax=Lonsdalea quercina TaxID=71657 RepID=A0ACD1J7X7_9GAMM|nr:hypothetical protein AU485_17385 [Lonsdalea quercina]RAT17724.1 hypothetical protein AU488_17480 [Lonsdalea populi]RAT19479.1 hypothetical protein AU489_17160 [Lonsdalea populi]